MAYEIWTCILCPDYPEFDGLGALNDHHKSVHIDGDKEEEPPKTDPDGQFVLFSEGP